MDTVKIGKKLKELREKAGETQSEVAKAVNVEPMSISYYESGMRIPRDEVKIRLAEHFNSSVADIFFAD